MPVDEGTLIAVKDGVVELTSSLSEPHREAASSFTEAMHRVLLDHQMQVMTDPVILNPYDLGVATCVVSRDPIPDGLKDGLISLGFAPVESEGGGRDQKSIFSRFQRSRRVKLDKWRLTYARAKDVSADLAAFEESLIEEVAEGRLVEIVEPATAALIDAARTCLRLLLVPNRECLGDLERRLLSERSGVRGRLVLHPRAVRALAAFVGESVRKEAPGSSWSEDPDADAPLLVSAGGTTVQSDPEYRAAKFVIHGKKELLTTYMDSVLAQSAPRGH